MAMQSTIAHACFNAVLLLVRSWQGASQCWHSCQQGGVLTSSRIRSHVSPMQELLDSAVLMLAALRRTDDPKAATSQPAGGGVIALKAGMGLGKTRVLEEVAARARAAGMLVLSSRSDAGRAGQVSPAVTRIVCVLRE